MQLTDEQNKLVIDIDRRANQILSGGGDDEELLVYLSDIMGNLKTIMDSSSGQEMDALCQRYSGFFRIMKLLEKLALGISNGEISV